MVAGGRRAAAYLRNTHAQHARRSRRVRRSICARLGRRLIYHQGPVVFATLKPPATFWGRFAVHGSF